MELEGGGEGGSMSRFASATRADARFPAALFNIPRHQARVVRQGFERTASGTKDCKPSPCLRAPAREVRARDEDGGRANVGG